MRTIQFAGADVARIGLGTNRLTNTPKNIAFIRAAAEAGVQLIDTAHLYTGGQSEETIGASFSPAPDGVTVATKGGFNGGAPETIRSEIRESLRKLRVKSIALYYLHRVDPDVPIEESLGAIKEAVEEGLIKHVGLSQVGVEQIERARKVVDVAAVQHMFNLGERQNDPVVDYCARERIPFVAFYPLHNVGGHAIDDVARKHRATPNQIALAWILRRSPVMVAIPGTLSIDHLKENLGALDIELSDQEFRDLS